MYMKSRGAESSLVERPQDNEEGDTEVPDHEGISIQAPDQSAISNASFAVEILCVIQYTSQLNVNGAKSIPSPVSQHRSHFVE